MHCNLQCNKGLRYAQQQSVTKAPDAVAAQGTIEEKRSFLRAFTRRVELDPDAGRGRLELYCLPRIQASSPGGNDALNSSFQMVAGARYEQVETIPGLVVNFSYPFGQPYLAA